MRVLIIMVVEKLEEVQNVFLNKLSMAQAQVSIYLINGVKLTGVIAKFDTQVIILQDQSNTVNQLIYKHAVSTIVPLKNNT